MLPSGGIGALYNFTMDPFEKYDMIFNGAVATRSTTTSPGRYAGMDNGLPDCLRAIIDTRAHVGFTDDNLHK